MQNAQNSIHFFLKHALLMFCISFNVIASIQIKEIHNLSYHPFNKYLLGICYVRGTALDTWNTLRVK